MSAAQVLVVVALVAVVVAALAGGVLAELSWRRTHPQVAAPSVPAQVAASSVPVQVAVAGAPGPGEASLRERVRPLFVFRLPVLMGALLAVVAVGGVYPLVVMARDGGLVGAVVFSGWSLTPFAVMAVVVAGAAHLSRAALVALVPGVLALGWLGVWILDGFDIASSSTASLIFIWLPVYQLGVVLVSVVVAALVALLVWAVRWGARRRRAGAGGRWA